MKVGRRKYREFVERGVAQGTRPDLQGGGLVRSASGDTSILSARTEEEREPSDARILGSGEFVSATLEQSESILVKKYHPKRPVDELIEFVAEKLNVEPELICSGSRKRKVSGARALVAYLAVEEVGHKMSDVARILGVKRVSIYHAVEKGRKLHGSGSGLVGMTN